MKKKPIYIGDLHFERKAWKSLLAFQVEELITFKHRLEELSQKQLGHDISAKVEQFQNQFIRHKEVLDTLLHEIVINNDALAKFAKEHPVALDHVHFKDHKVLRNSIEKQIELFTKLKNKYMRFLTSTM